MLATIQPVARPSAAVASILIAGEGLSLVAAYLFMAASFKRNVDAGLDNLFTRLALVVAAVSVSAVVVGTIETIEVKDLAITIVLLGIIVLVVLTLVGSLSLARIPCVKVKSQAEACADAPKGIDDTEERAHVPSRARALWKGISRSK
jgi:hypothetical protein